MTRCEPDWGGELRHRSVSGKPALVSGLSHRHVAQLERRVLDVATRTGPPPSLLAAVWLLADMAPGAAA